MYEVSGDIHAALEHQELILAFSGVAVDGRDDHRPRAWVSVLVVDSRCCEHRIVRHVVRRDVSADAVAF